MYDKIMSGGISDMRVNAALCCCVFVVSTVVMGALLGVINEGNGC